MSLTDGDVNLLCFDFAPHGQGAKVVLWLAHEAQQEYFRWDAAFRTNEDELVRYEDFTVPVARDFDSFLRLLRSTP